MATTDRIQDESLFTAAPDVLLDHYAVPSRLGSRPGLERIKQLLEALGHPQSGLRIVHIGGTSGKGSTATITAALLRAADYRVGLHVKPHLESVEERFQVNGRQIAPAELSNLIQQVGPLAKDIQASWYELTVALAFAYFRREAVDVAVVEVGLGGTYDATNVIEPVAIGLTNVDLDHTEILGDTVEKIAADKVGIIKSGLTVVSGATQPSVQQIVANQGQSVGATVWQVGREVRIDSAEVTTTGSWFDIETPKRRMSEVRLSPLGRHQVYNAAIAVGLIDAICDTTLAVSNDQVREALSSVVIPGRFEIVGTGPLVVLDGAHNPAKMASLRAALQQLYPDRPVSGVLAFKRGHDLAATVAVIAPALSRVYLTRFDAATDYGRGQSVETATIAEIWSQVGGCGHVEVHDDPVEAVRKAISSASAQDIVCVTGSLYLVGVVRGWLRARH